MEDLQAGSPFSDSQIPGGTSHSPSLLVQWTLWPQPTSESLLEVMEAVVFTNMLSSTSSLDMVRSNNLPNPPYTHFILITIQQTNWPTQQAQNQNNQSNVKAMKASAPRHRSQRFFERPLPTSPKYPAWQENESRPGGKRVLPGWQPSNIIQQHGWGTVAFPPLPGRVWFKGRSWHFHRSEPESVANGQSQVGHKRAGSNNFQIGKETPLGCNHV